ncbi:MAG TPA: energy-coupling factor transporter ATPase [Ktedonobacteraceae bacterium]|nr:energy-coupling factor transporter ATPase [Ktedonobacteraceae bacterium]
MNDTIIRTQHLCYTYAAQQASLRRPALIDITLEIAQGSCSALIGVTGSGKSTLVQHLNGLLRPTSGSVLVDGVEVGAVGTDLQQLRQRVGMLFQFPEAQLFERTVFADVAFGPQRLHLARQEIRTRVVRALEMVGLPHKEYAQRSPFELSGGQRRRVALAGVLAMQPVILVLDEPGVGLDAEGKAEFYAQIHDLKRQGITVVLVSHDMAEVATLADQIFVLDQGSLVMEGTPREIFAQPATLRDHGLAPPPLSSLLMHMRQRGLEVPAELMTVDDVFDFLTQKHRFDSSR